MHAFESPLVGNASLTFCLLLRYFITLLSFASLLNRMPEISKCLLVLGSIRFGNSLLQTKLGRMMLYVRVCYSNLPLLPAFKGSKKHYCWKHYPSCCHKELSVPFFGGQLVPNDFKHFTEVHLFLPSL